jgi:peptidoglycan-N-acetylglucosamine deacetylase
MQNRKYQWPGGKSCAFVFSVDVDAESPFLWDNRGKAVVGLGELEQRRFGPREGLYRITDLLAEFSARGSFYVPGVVADTYPEILPHLMEHGHEVGLHGYYHERVEQLTPAQNAAVLDKSIVTYQRHTGQDPRGYRSPAWELTPGLIDMLRTRGILYDSSLMGYDHPYTIDGLTEVPVQWLLDDAIYFKFSGGGKDAWHFAAPDAVFDRWVEEFEGQREFGGLFMLTCHPWISGRAQRIRLLRRLMTYIAQYDDIWWATAAEVAAHHAAMGQCAAFAVTAELIDTDFCL